MKTTQTIKHTLLASSLLLGAAISLASTAPAYASTGSVTTCNAHPATKDFSATYAAGWVTTATVTYTNAAPLCNGVNQVISFNAYLTQGSSWTTSGTQTLVDRQTVTLSNGKTSATMQIKLPAANCFYQTDVYLGSTRYDGTDGASPKYPATTMSSVLLAARNGGATVCKVATPTPTPTPSATPTATPTPGQGEVLGTSTRTTLPDTGAGDLAFVFAGISSAAGYAALKLRNRK